MLTWFLNKTALSVEIGRLWIDATGSVSSSSSVGVGVGVGVGRGGVEAEEEDAVGVRGAEAERGREEDGTFRFAWKFARDGCGGGPGGGA